jgi:hypothetical protein
MLVATSAHLFAGWDSITGSELHGTEPGSAQAPPRLRLLGARGRADFHGGGEDTIEGACSQIAIAPACSPHPFVNAQRRVTLPSD